ncbi:hypothetical protein HDV06_001524 [Boothiomyces sp. JEL0866]|nr:hypothetical protein HDV06_001524 [Boothiomyces sp. JEL0866]
MATKVRDLAQTVESPTNYKTLVLSVKLSTTNMQFALLTLLLSNVFTAPIANDLAIVDKRSAEPKRNAGKGKGKKGKKNGKKGKQNGKGDLGKKIADILSKIEQQGVAAAGTGAIPAKKSDTIN